MRLRPQTTSHKSVERDTEPYELYEDVKVAEDIGMASGKLTGSYIWVSLQWDVKGVYIIVCSDVTTHEETT